MTLRFPFPTSQSAQVLARVSLVREQGSDAPAQGKPEQGSDAPESAPAPARSEARSRERRNALEYRARVRAYLKNPRNSDALKLALCEYLLDIPAAERVSSLRSEIEITDIRESTSEIVRANLAKARSEARNACSHAWQAERARLRARAPELDSDAPRLTLRLPKSDDTTSDDCELELLVIDGSYDSRRLTRSLPLAERGSLAPLAVNPLANRAPARAVCTVRVDLASRIPELDALSRQASGAEQAREQAKALADYLAPCQTIVTHSPKPFQGSERFGMLRACSDAIERASRAPSGSGADYRQVYVDGVYSHTTLATRSDALIPRSDGSLLAVHELACTQPSEQGSELAGAGCNGLLTISDCVCSRGFPSPDSRATLPRESEREQAQARELAGARLAPRLAPDVRKVQARSEARIARKRARFDGTASKRGASKRKRGSQRSEAAS